jgi:hypothetical protein
MNRLLYYPFFEIQDKNWLKFALLYAERVNLIVPNEGDRFLSDRFREIYESTDLLKLYRPNFHVAYNASLDAIEEIDKILRNPTIYNHAFNINRNMGVPNIIERWMNNQNFQFELFSHKYSYEFSQYCVENRLAIPSGNGLLLSKELAHLYMALLARVIGDKENYSPISDIKQYEYVINRLRRGSNTDDTITLAKNIIEVKLPKNINHIEIHDIIRLRNSHGFSNKLKAFHTALDNFHSSIENGTLTLEFLKQYENPFNEMVEEMKKLSLDLASFGIGAWLVLNNPNYVIPEVLRDVIIGGLIFYSGHRIKIKQTWTKTQNNLMVRCYLTGVRRIEVNKKNTT